jgi:hypothetical protein
LPAGCGKIQIYSGFERARLKPRRQVQSNPTRREAALEFTVR